MAAGACFLGSDEKRDHISAIGQTFSGEVRRAVGPARLHPQQEGHGAETCTALAAPHLHVL